MPQVIVVNPQRVWSTTCRACSPTCKNRAKLNHVGRQRDLAPPRRRAVQLQTKTYITHIPYPRRRAGAAGPVAGQVDILFDGLASSAVHIRPGIKALAVAAPQRAPGFPEILTTAEAGVPSYVVHLFGPAGAQGTPKRWWTPCAPATKALTSDELRKAWNGLGAETPDLYGGAFGKFVNAGSRWAEVVIEL